MRNKGRPSARKIETLLPWHAAGTLSRRDAQRVEEALARDLACAPLCTGARVLGSRIHLRSQRAAANCNNDNR
jgi:hypothetical protein